MDSTFGDLTKMKFIKPERNIIEKSKYKLECECWKPYTNPIVSIVYWSRLKAIFNYLKNRRWKLILEIGCGYGFFLPSLCQISDRVIGSDIEDMFDFCEKVTLRKIQKNYANLKLKKADARNLSEYIDEDSCDAIVAVSVLEHIDDYDGAVKEIRKCLKPSGIFICVLPSENGFYKLCKRLVGYRGDYHKHYNYEKLRANLRKNFREVKKWNCPFGTPLFFVGIYERK
jgi:SAM-dependent methyltransferase